MMKQYKLSSTMRTAMLLAVLAMLAALVTVAKEGLSSLRSQGVKEWLRQKLLSSPTP